MRVAIIGAGLAGLVAGAELKKRGAQVVIFEKSRGNGGRLATKRLDWGHLDIGAQYFTARSESFKSEVRRWEQHQTVAPWPLTPFKLINGVLSPSGDDQRRYVGIPDMNEMARYLADSLEVHVETRIDKLQHRHAGWTLVSVTGESHSDFDWVILSLPAEQSKALLTDTSDVADLIPATVHSPCWALGLATRGAVAEHIQGIFGDDTISWASRLSSRPQRQAHRGYDDLWMLHFSPAWSTANGKDTNLDIADIGLDWLQSVLQTPLTAAHDYRHFWRYANIKDTALSIPPLVDSHQQLAVIGAWCRGGRVEGAYLSAMDLVEDCFLKV
ncbi:FAD-binding protein [Exilibacterium tricleocarpae]|uniref:FAD-binding protein n=1 Tax=Exilibacterium tricleocarpae TaxID=2591008 RepID=A0A545U4B8_9GAMM|nr:NAD(P)-binding protein [Exilibacterium tricleocarpae]TQV84296.1 FAD-binding protein [Exilibacterium tricleocarpae]